MQLIFVLFSLSFLLTVFFDVFPSRGSSEGFFFSLEMLQVVAKSSVDSVYSFIHVYIEIDMRIFMYKCVH